MAETGPTLRFASLVRVSTERQEREGESLPVQRQANEDAVQSLGGKIVQWYGGQEHATDGHERKEIDRLLRDAQRKPRPWDALIVTVPDRWSRDNAKSKEGIDVFKRCHVRFFVGKSEFDLFNPEHTLQLGIYAEFGKYVSERLAKASMESRIERARNGIPTAGKPPWGRTYDKATKQWGVDHAKKAVIEKVARRYLRGESLEKLANEFGLRHCNLHKVLTKRCGPTWEVEFNSDRFNIHRKVQIQIPPLLDEETIKAIHQRVQANKTYAHGQIKNRYLLSRMVFCETCGYAMFGQQNHNGHLYYRHARKRNRPCSAPGTWIRADGLEEAVFRILFNALGNPVAVKTAMEAAIPDQEKARELRERESGIEQELAQEKKGHDSILRLVRRGATTEEEADGQLQESRQRAQALRQELENVRNQLTNVPTLAQVVETANQVQKAIRRYASPAEVKLNARISLANTLYERMTPREKRDLAQKVFSGMVDQQRRMGVYILPATDATKRRKQHRFIIRGHLTKLVGTAPMTENALRDLVDPDYCGAQHVPEAVTNSASR
jgi:DNA invertase Pin-like site-specific DNA recombinase